MWPEVWSGAFAARAAHRVLFLCQLGPLAFENTSALHINVDIFTPLGRNATFAVDGFNWARRYACATVDAVIRINDQHVTVLVETFDRAFGDAIGVLAITTRFSHHMRHGKSSNKSTKLHQGITLEEHATLSHFHRIGRAGVNKRLSSDFQIVHKWVSVLSGRTDQHIGSNSLNTSMFVSPLDPRRFGALASQRRKGLASTQ